MNNKTLATILVLGIASIGGTALAGAKSAYDVSVFDGGFSGTFGTVRNSTNQSSWLRCETNASSNGGAGTYLCDAYDGSKYRSCSGSSPQLLAAIQSLNGDDYVYVQYSGTTCSYIYTSKASFNEPKKP
jgi:hypothetical protein